MSEYRHWSTGVEVQTPQYSQGFQVKEFVELPRFGGRGDGGDTGPDGFDAARGIEDDVFVVTRSFRPSSKRPDVAIPPDEYTFTSFRLGPDTANYRKWQLDFDFLVGTYYTGHLYRVTAENAYRPNGRLGIDLIYDGNWIRLPEGNLNIQALSTRLIYSFTTDFFFKIFAQWNSDSESVGANFLLNYRFRPGSDIFFVYDHGFGTAGDLHQASRAVLLKVSYLIGL